MSIASASRRGKLGSLKRTRNELLRLQRGPLTRGHISRRMLINQSEAQKVLKKEEEPEKILMYVR